MRMTISKEDALTLKNEPINVTAWSNKHGHEVLINAPLKSDNSVYAKFVVFCTNRREADELVKKFTNLNPQLGHFRVIA